MELQQGKHIYLVFHTWGVAENACVYISSEDRIVFMTTNHIDRLDPALIRPGRVDYCQHIGDATNFQIKKLFQKFYASTADIDADGFVQALRVRMSYSCLTFSCYSRLYIIFLI